MLISPKINTKLFHIIDAQLFPLPDGVPNLCHNRQTQVRSGGTLLQQNTPNKEQMTSHQIANKRLPQRAKPIL